MDDPQSLMGSLMERGYKHIVQANYQTARKAVRLVLQRECDGKTRPLYLFCAQTCSHDDASVSNFDCVSLRNIDFAAYSD